MTNQSNTKNYPRRAIGMAVLAATLIAAPWGLPLTTGASAQTAAPAAAPAAPAAPAATDSAAKTKTKKPPSPGQVAMHERQKKCAAEWKQAKADGKLEKGMKWPKFWSACNKRLKGAS
jgi:hypothetical protein